MKSMQRARPKVAADATRESGNATRAGKAELCSALMWSRTRLDRRLESDRNFPVLRRGNRGGGWEFDLAAVMHYLGRPPVAARAAQPLKPSAADAWAPASSTVPAEVLEQPTSTEHQGEMTQRQRRDAAQASILEDKLRIARGELVESEEMRLVLTTMLAHLAKGLDGMPDVIVSQLDLPPEKRIPLTILFDQLRETMVRDLRPLLQPVQPVATASS